MSVLVSTMGAMFTSAQIISLIDCTYQPSAKYYLLNAEPTVHCFDAAWFASYFPLALSATLFYGALPLTISLSVSSHQDELRVMDSFVFKAFSGWFWKYRRNHALWENVVLSRKILLVLTVTLLSEWPVRTCFCLLTLLSECITLCTPDKSLFHRWRITCSSVSLWAVYSSLY